MSTENRFSRAAVVALAVLIGASAWASAPTESHAATVALFTASNAANAAHAAHAGKAGKAKKARNAGKAGNAGKRDNKSRGKGQRKAAGHKKKARSGKGAAIKASLARTSKLVRAAALAAREDETLREDAGAAILHQRAARLAVKKRKPAAALWLTRTAREKARAVLVAASAEVPSDSSDTEGEWQKANEKGASKLIALAKKLKPSKEVASKLKETKAVILSAAAAVKEGGEGKDQLRMAVVLQKAARRAGINKSDKAALALTAKALEAARAALEANGVSAPDGDAAAYEGSESEEVADAVEEASDEAESEDYSESVEDVEAELELEE